MWKHYYWLNELCKLVACQFVRFVPSKYADNKVKVYLITTIKYCFEQILSHCWNYLAWIDGLVYSIVAAVDGVLSESHLPLVAIDTATDTVCKKRTYLTTNSNS